MPLPPRAHSRNRLYHGDHANPPAPRVRLLAEEVARVLRSRAVNPKWILSARRHGYKGTAEMAAAAEYLFGYAATSPVAERLAAACCRSRAKASLPSI